MAEPHLTVIEVQSVMRVDRCVYICVKGIGRVQGTAKVMQRRRSVSMRRIDEIEVRVDGEALFGDTGILVSISVPQGKTFRIEYDPKPIDGGRFVDRTAFIGKEIPGFDLCLQILSVPTRS